MKKSEIYYLEEILAQNELKIFFVGRVMGNTGFEKQFLMEAKELEKFHDVKCYIFALESFRKIVKNITYIIKRRQNIYFIPNLFEGRKIFKVFNIAYLFAFIHLFRLQPDIVHCHTLSSCFMFIKIKKMFNFKYKVIFDSHGLPIEESLLSKTIKLNSLKHKKMIFQINYIGRYADKIFCVTHKMKKFYNENYDYPINKILITPSNVKKQFIFNEEYRVISRKEKQIDDKFVVAFIGSINNAWQVGEKFNNIIKSMIKIIPNLYFLILTENTEYFINLFREYNFKQNEYEIKFVKYDNVPTEIMCADVGIIVRDDNIVNNVASPIKFGEYLGLGIPIFANREIGDIEKYYFLNNKIGYIFSIHEKDYEKSVKKMYEKLAKYDNETRKNISDFAHSMFSLEKTTEIFVTTYNHITKDTK